MVTESARTQNGVEARILRIFRDTLELDVEVDTDVIAEDMLDSVAFVQLLLSLETEFGMRVELAEMDLDDFCSVARIAMIVRPDRIPST